MDNAYKFKDILAKKGLRSTAQRNAVLDVMEQAAVPLTAEEIYLHLKEKNIPASLSTIYRTLDALISKRMVTKSVIMGESKAKYEIQHEDEHRHNLICLGCTKTIKIDECPLGELENSLHKSTDFDVTGHKLEIYGYCPQCKNCK